MLTSGIQRSPSTSNQEEPAGILQFLIILIETDPLVWRRIQVPHSYAFWDLHVAIKNSIGWSESNHLHQFEVWNKPRKRFETIGIPGTEERGERIKAGWDVSVTSALADPSIPFSYTYDFGDKWRHIIIHETGSLPDSSVTYPRCLSGAGKCPPEDIGGTAGFQEYLAAIQDEKHPQHEFYMEWIGGPYDATDFDPENVAFDDPQEILVELAQG